MSSATVQRPLTQADIPAVRGLMQAGYAYVGQSAGFTARQIEGAMARRHSAAAWGDYLQTYTHCGVWQDVELLAVCAVHEDEGCFLYVQPAAHGRGIGTALLRWAARQIRDGGHAHMRLSAWPSGIAYYQRFGFCVIEWCAVPEGPMAGHPYARMACDLTGAPWLDVR